MLDEDERDGIVDACAMLDPDFAPAPACSVCGAPMEWMTCYGASCEDGTIFGDALMEEDPLWYSLDDTEPCGECGGAGGWWQCFETHPGEMRRS